MDLVTFIEDNWFAVGSLITLIGFTVKLSRNVQKHIDSFEVRTSKLEAKDREIYKIIEKNNDQLRTELKEMRDEIKSEFKSNLADLDLSMTESIQSVNSRLNEIESKRVEGAERTRIMLDGIEATLQSLHNEGHNGPVTKSLQEIHSYKSRKAATD